MNALLAGLLGGILIVFDVLPPASQTPSASRVDPIGTNGFAAYIVGGFFAVGLILLVMVLIGRRPKGPRRDPIPRPR